MTSRDDVIIKKWNQIWNSLVHSFDLRYRTTMLDQRFKMTPFSAPYYDVIMSFPGVSDVIKSWPQLWRGSIWSLRKIVRAVFEGPKIAWFWPLFSQRVPRQTEYGHTRRNSAKEISVSTHFFSLTFKKWVKTKISYTRGCAPRHPSAQEKRNFLSHEL